MMKFCGLFLGLPHNVFYILNVGLIKTREGQVRLFHPLSKSHVKGSRDSDYKTLLGAYVESGRPRG